MVLSSRSSGPNFSRFFDDHAAAVERARMLVPRLQQLADAAISVLGSGGKLLLCGNGGSAADCQHIAAELTIRFELDRRSLPAIALTTDSSALTAAGNDFGFAQVFARQVAGLGQKGDLLIAITTSGNSENVVLALKEARQVGLATACLTGGSGGKVAAENLADICILAPSDTTARIQELHIFFGHMICAAIDSAFAKTA